jgi:hypothetical protein
MGLRFECGECGAEIRVRSLGPGDPIPCWRCEAVAIVPADAEAVDVPDPPSREDPPYSVRSRWGGFAGVATLLRVWAFLQLLAGIVVGVLLANSGVGGLAILAWIGTVVWTFLLLGLAQGVEMLLAMAEDLHEIKRALPPGRGGPHRG